MNREMVKMNALIEEISMGPFGSDIKIDNYVGYGIPVLNGSNVSSVKMTEEFSNYLTVEKADSLKKANAKRGDIVITHRGTLGQISYIPYDSRFERYVISQSQFRVSLKKDLVDPVYFTYYFHSSEGQKRLLSFKNHVGVPALAQPTTNFRLLDFPYHSLPEQKAIAKILSDLDAKIELNNRINAELEAMAKLIYDYWFVQFDFPNEQGKPYKSSGGKMVYNKELKREIPEGWPKGTLNDIGTVIGGSTPSKAIKENFCQNYGTPWITPKDLSLNKGNKFITRGEFDATPLGIKDASLNLMPKGTILLSSRAPIGYLAISREIVTTNQGFKSFVPDKGYSTEFIYYSVKNMIPAIEKNAVGSTFKEVSGSTLKGIVTPLPPVKLVNTYNKKVESIFQKQDLLELENQQLASLRDWLLPMLMNGQVTVKEAEEKVSELGMVAEEEIKYQTKK